MMMMKGIYSALTLGAGFRCAQSAERSVVNVEKKKKKKKSQSQKGRRPMAAATSRWSTLIGRA